MNEHHAVQVRFKLQGLYEEWNMPVYDRYNIVMEIFKFYAQTEEARLQIKLAEIPYIRWGF